MTTRHAWLVGLVAAAIVGGAALGFLPILHLSLLGALVLVVGRVVTPGEARGAVDLDVVLVIAAAFGLGSAMMATGLADRIAGAVVGAFGGFGERGVLAGVLLATVGLKSIVGNNATAVLMFPVAVTAAAEVGGSPRGFALSLAIASSAAFLTPIAYQTNLMVYGPGGYRFGDYARLGVPVTLVVVGVLVVLAPILFG